MNIVDWTSSRFDSLRERLGENRFYTSLLGVLVIVGLLPLLMPSSGSGGGSSTSCLAMNPVTGSSATLEFLAVSAMLETSMSS